MHSDESIWKKLRNCLLIYTIIFITIFKACERFNESSFFTFKLIKIHFGVERRTFAFNLLKWYKLKANVYFSTCSLLEIKDM